MKLAPWIAFLFVGAVNHGTGFLPGDVPTPTSLGIDITHDGFAPQVPRIPAGTAVTWTNLESVHTTTSRDGLWDSGVLTPGDSFSYVFDTVGLYHYYDTIHDWPCGTVEVVHSLASIDVDVDGTLYAAGDSIDVALHLENSGEAVQAGVYVWVEGPGGAVIWLLQVPAVLIPAGFSYGDSAWMTLTLPTLTRGEYEFGAAILKIPEQDVVSTAGDIVVFGEAIASDWSGGPGMPGPVPDWTDAFDTSNGVAWRSLPGQLALSTSPRGAPLESVIAFDANRPNGVATGDLNGNGTDEVVTSDAVYHIALKRGAIYWWELLGTGAWVQHTVDDDFYGAHHVDTVDLDGDGDVDVIAAAYYGDGPGLGRNGKYAWFENLDGTGTAWTKHLVGDYFWGATYIHAGDLDGDGDLDLVGASELTDGIDEQEADVAWFENFDGKGVTWVQHDLDVHFDNAGVARITDLDGDGDLDVVGGNSDPYGPSQFAWWENVNADGTAFTKHVIPYSFWGSGYLGTGDIDNDGDIDLMGGGYNTSTVGWWENLDGTGTSWVAWTVTAMPSGRGAELRDVDGDGDLDGILWNTWWAIWVENVDGTGRIWNPRTLTTQVDRPWATAGDVDDDGKLELVVTSEEVNSFPGIQVLLYDVSTFASPGDLTSSILDGGATPDWGSMTWEATVPADTSLLVEVRAANDAANLGPYVTVPYSGFDLSNLINANARYLQYRFDFASTDLDRSPQVRSLLVEKGPGW